jgi:RNA ligase (TIGR02306 family)
MTGTTSARKLATVRIISRVDRIPNADRIAVARVGGWPVVIGRDEFKVGDKVVYFEPDSMLPLDRPEFAALAGRGAHGVNPDGVDCVILRSVKLRGQLSQGLVMSPAELGIDPGTPEGADVSAALHVHKYEQPLIEIPGARLGGFPGFITRTDEQRIQDLTDMVAWMLDGHLDVAAAYHGSEKLDGMSTTYYRVERDDETEYGVCSHDASVERVDVSVHNPYWDNYEAYSIRDRLDAIAADTGASSVVIQGESTGPGILGNRLDARSLEFHAFNLVIDGCRIDPYADGYGLADITVPQRAVGLPLSENMTADDGVDAIIAASDGVRSALNPARLAEGIVWRYDGPTVNRMADDWRHFKSISNKYLLKTKS